MSDYSTYSATEDRTMPAVVYGLYFLGFATAGLTSIVGAVIAHAQRGVSDGIAHSHYTFQIRTFWLGLAWMFVAGLLMGVGIPLSFILIGIPLLILAKLMFALGALWYGIRLVVGVIYLSRGEPHPRPYAVLA
jgi:uncharacterized membrane protein